MKPLTRDELARDWRHRESPANGPDDYLADRAFKAGFDAATERMKLSEKDRSLVEYYRASFPSLADLMIVIDRLTSGSAK